MNMNVVLLNRSVVYRIVLFVCVGAVIVVGENMLGGRRKKTYSTAIGNATSASLFIQSAPKRNCFAVARIHRRNRSAGS